MRILGPQHRPRDDGGPEPVSRPASCRCCDVIENGYWHARSLAYTAGTLPRLLEWLRLPGDLVFIFLGALPIASALGLGYLGLWTRLRVDTRKVPATE